MEKTGNNTGRKTVWTISLRIVASLCEVFMEDQGTLIIRSKEELNEYLGQLQGETTVRIIVDFDQEE